MGDYISKLLDKEFVDTTMKSAYMKAVKWLATNVIHEDNVNRYVVYSIEKLVDKNVPTVKLTLHTRIPEEVPRERHCKICKEVHGTFYMGADNCETCKLKAYHRRVDDIMSKEQSILREKMLAKEESKNAE